MKADFKRDMFSKYYYNAFYIFFTLGKWKIGLLYNNRTRFNFKEW